MADAPIDLYTWTTPNGRKASIMLEEIGLPYRVHPVDIGKGAQFEAGYRARNPNSKIPAIHDPDGPGGQPIDVFESGAILIYLAEKSGKLLSTEPRTRIVTIQWLMFQMAGIGPMFGQAGHFFRKTEKIPYAIERYTNEAKRLYGVLDERLSQSEYLAGSEFSIADVATWPWVAAHPFYGVDPSSYAHVKRWYEAVGQRPAVQRGMKIPG